MPAYLMEKGEGDRFVAHTTLPSGREISVITSGANRVFAVRFWREEGDRAGGVSFRPDGSVVYLFNDGSDHCRGRSVTDEGAGEEREVLRQRILEIAELMEPGITEKITQVEDEGDQIADGVRYAVFSLMVEGQDSRSVCVTLTGQILVEYGTGNG